MTGLRLRTAFPLALAVACAAPAAMAQTGGAPAVQIAVAAPPETVYRWAAQKCDANTIPDAPARAFRNREGIVRLIAASSSNWSMAGPDLGALRVDCHPLIQGSQSADPAKFDDLVWIEAVYTPDGQNVIALLSDEWNAFRHPGTPLAAASGCTDPHHQNCYFYAITEARSDDGGRQFSYASTHHLVAAQPAPFEGRPASKAAEGFATVSNIVHHAGYLYVFAGSRGGGGQPAGNCLLRTRDPNDPAAWRGWDGAEFSVQFHNPYRSAAAARSCQPIAIPGNGTEEVRSLSWYPPARSFIAVVRGVLQDFGASGKQAGFFYSTSPDLIHWSAAALLMPIALQRDCVPLVFYPSILDPSAGSANFEEIGAQPFVYYARFNITPATCRGTMDRDLVRTRLSIRPR